MEQLLCGKNAYLKHDSIISNVVPIEKSIEYLNAHPRQHLLFVSPEHGLKLYCRHWNVTTREYVICKYSPRDATTKGHAFAKRVVHLLTKSILLLFALFFLAQFLFFQYLFEFESVSASEPLASATSILYSISVFSFRYRREWLIVFYQSCYLAFSLYFLFLYYYAFYRSKVVSESLLVIRHFGLQASATFVGGRKTTHRFVPFSQLSPPYLIEAMKGLQVHYYLIAGIRDEKNLMLFFPNTRPPRAMLALVGRGIRRRFPSCSQAPSQPLHGSSDNSSDSYSDSNLDTNDRHRPHDASRTRMLDDC